MTRVRGTWSSVAGKGYRGTELHAYVCDRLTGPGRPSPRPLALVLHGANQDAHAALLAGSYAGTTGLQVAQALWDAGFDMVAVDAGGTQNWGNADSQAALDVAVSFAAALGMRTDLMVCVSYSMGALTFLNYALRRAAGTFKGFVGVIPALNAKDIYDNNRFGSAAFMDTAYAAQGGWPASEPLFNPWNRLAEATALNVPTRLLYSGDDPVTLATFVTGYAAAVDDATAVQFNAAAGHSMLGLDPLAPAAFLATEVDEFLGVAA